MGGHVVLTCTPSAEKTAAAIAHRFRTHPQVFPDSIHDQPEAAFLQYFCPPGRSRDTVVMIADDKPVLYWLLRALHMSPEESMAAGKSYAIRHGSVTLINVRSDGSMKVVCVGDTG